MFRRTDFGIAAEHQFYDVDYIAYCEGRGLTEHEMSLDEQFWQRVFRDCPFTVHCKSTGSVSNLRPLAQDIVDRDIKNTLVLMDRDYSDLKQTMIADDRVIYSFGYSWESDAVNQFNFDEIFNLFCTPRDLNTFRQSYSNYQQQLSVSLRRPYALDFKYIDCPLNLFDRLKPLSIIELDSYDYPVLKTSTLLENARAIGKFQSGSLPGDVYQNCCGMRSFFGKAVAKMIYHWFVKASQAFDKANKISYNLFMSSVIRNIDLADFTLERNRYFRQVTRQVAAL